MKNVIFCTNLPSPYRVDFFNEWGKYCHLTVLYERHTSSERNGAWKGAPAKNFREVYMGLKLVGVDQSKGSALRKDIETHDSDILIFTNYVSPATMEAIIWCRLHGRKYYIEYDGGFNKKDSFAIGLLKKFLLRGAEGHLTTADEHVKYSKSLGIDKRKIHKYPFTSISEKDIAEANTLTANGRCYFKQKLAISEQKMILTIGRFSYDRGYGKGYDVLMNLAERLGSSVGVYIIGDEPTQEFLDWKVKKNLVQVHFVTFKSKKELADYYGAADLFVMLSRGDVWGLVINEAMAFGLPIITSDRCIAGLELVNDGENGHIVDIEDIDLVEDKVKQLLKDEDLLVEMGKNSYLKILKYTIETMATSHQSIFWGG